MRLVHPQFSADRGARVDYMPGSWFWTLLFGMSCFIVGMIVGAVYATAWILEVVGWLP